MKPPTDPPAPENADERRPDRSPTRRPGGHGGYRIGGEPAVGHRWQDARPPTAASRVRFDDGVPHRHRQPGEEDLLHNQDVDHEHSDTNIRAVIGSTVVLVVVMAVSSVLMWLLFGFLESRAAANDPPVSPLAIPGAEMPRNTAEAPVFNPAVGGPQLLTNEPLGLAKHRETELERLHGYGWVNQGAGVAFIPIEEAMKRIRERGLPVREGGPVDPTLGTRVTSRGEASGGRVMVMGETPATAPSIPPPPRQGDTPVGDAPTAKPQGEAPAAKPHGPGGH
jgi:hypothetical protein